MIRFPGSRVLFPVLARAPLLSAATLLLFLAAGCADRSRDAVLPENGVDAAAAGIGAPITPGAAPATGSGTAQTTAEQSEAVPVRGGRAILALTFMGDIMAHDVNFNRTPYGPIWEAISPLVVGDDITFANLEFPIAPDRPLSGYPAFNAPLAYAAAAVAAGVDCLSLANNHANDQGPSGVAGTVKGLASLSVAGTPAGPGAGGARPWFSGTRGSAKEPFSPAIIETSGWKVGFIAGTQFLNGPAGAELVRLVPLGSGAAVDGFLRDVTELAAKTDLVVVSFHGGTEYRLSPEEEIAAFYRRLLDAGADIVWGHHPHVLQPWEIAWRDGRNGLILYSTGNVISGQRWRVDPLRPESAPRLDTGDSALFSVRVAWTGERASVCGVSPQPITNYRKPSYASYGMIILPLDAAGASEDIPWDWRRFFTERAQIMAVRILPYETRRVPEEP